MGRQRLNPRIAKTHRNYTIEETAKKFSVHKNTVHEWIRRGLPTIDRMRPTLILGEDLTAFLRERRLKNKQKCRAGELFCVRCRAPRAPAGAMADYQPWTEKLGNLLAICSTCGALMNRRIRADQLAPLRGILDITVAQDHRRIADTRQPSVNSDFE
jgi:hypothetical protein